MGFSEWLRKHGVSPIIDLDDARTARLMWVICWGALAAQVGFGLLTWLRTPASALVIIQVAFIPFLLLALFWLRQGKVRSVSWLLLGSSWLLIASSSLLTGGVSSPIFTGVAVVIVLAGFLVGHQAALGFTILSGVFSFLMAVLNLAGMMPPPILVLDANQAWFTLFAYLLGIWGLLYLATLGLREAVTGYRREIAEREQAQHQWQESEERYRALFEQTNDAVFFIDLKGQIIRANQKAALMFGYPSKEDFIGTSAVKNIAPAETNQLPIRLAEIISGKQIPIYERTFIRYDGSKFVGEVNVTVVQDQNGIPKHIQSIVRDISERKREEAERERLLQGLHHRSNQIQTAFEVSKTAADYLDPEPLLWQVCNLIHERFGYYYVGLFLVNDHGENAVLRAGSGEAGQVMVLQEHQLPVGGQSMIGWAIANNQARSTTNVGEETIHFKNPLLPETRSELALPLAVRGQVIGALTVQSRSEEGFSPDDMAVLQVMADQVATSIKNAQLFKAAEQRAVEAETLRSISQAVTSSLNLQETIDHILEQLAVVVPYDSGSVQLLREGIMEIVGGRGFPEGMEAKIGKRFPIQEGTVSALITQTLQPAIIDDVQVNFPAFRDKEKNGIHGWMGIPLILHQKLIGLVTLDSLEVGRFTPEHARLAAAFANQVGIALENARLHAEVTQYAAELEQRVRERTTQLEAANKELEAFAYSVSHDLRAPLRAINGFSHILMEEYSEQLPPEARRFQQMVADNAVRMSTLIDDLLTYSRLGRRPIARQQLDPTALVMEVLADFEQDLKNRSVKLQIDPLPPCEADPMLLKLVFQNLLGNAIKFSAHKGQPEIQVGAADTEHGTSYFVRDNGAGFDMAYAGKLFGVFQRLHSEEEFPGTGVGLATVQRLIHRHGGLVWFDAVVDQGAVFYFTIPPQEP